ASPLHGRYPMTDEPGTAMRERACRALERSLRSDSPPPNEGTDPELLARLDAALRSLPRRRHEIFLAVRQGGAGYAELAEQTGLSVRKVEREIARAIAQIDRFLERGKASPPHPWW